MRMRAIRRNRGSKRMQVGLRQAARMTGRNQSTIHPRLGRRSLQRDTAGLAVRQQPGQPLLHPTPLVHLGVEAGPQIANHLVLAGNACLALGKAAECGRMQSARLLTHLDHFRPRFGFLWAGTLKQINHLNRARG